METVPSSIPCKGRSYSLHGDIAGLWEAQQQSIPPYAGLCSGCPATYSAKVQLTAAHAFVELTMWKSKALNQHSTFIQTLDCNSTSSYQLSRGIVLLQLLRGRMLSQNTLGQSTAPWPGEPFCRPQDSERTWIGLSMSSNWPIHHSSISCVSYLCEHQTHLLTLVPGSWEFISVKARTISSPLSSTTGFSPSPLICSC